MTTGYESPAEKQKEVCNREFTNKLDRVPQVYVPGEKYVPYDVTYKSDEFTSVCPKTSLPDYASLEITYKPNQYLVELKSLKLYLNEYRNIGIFQEHVANKIFDDFWKAAEPLYLKVFIHFGARGGIDTKVTVEKWQAASILTPTGSGTSTFQLRYCATCNMWYFGYHVCTPWTAVPYNPVPYYPNPTFTVTK